MSPGSMPQTVTRGRRSAGISRQTDRSPSSCREARPSPSFLRDPAGRGYPAAHPPPRHQRRAPRRPTPAGGALPAGGAHLYREHPRGERRSLELLDHVHADTVVAEQQIAEAGDQDARSPAPAGRVGPERILSAGPRGTHCATAAGPSRRTFGGAEGRMTCTAQDRHGSKEWITRSTSIGWSQVRAPACRSGPARSGPVLPASSRGEAFQPVGVMTW